MCKIDQTEKLFQFHLLREMLFCHKKFNVNETDQYKSKKSPHWDFFLPELIRLKSFLFFILLFLKAVFFQIVFLLFGLIVACLSNLAFLLYSWTYNKLLMTDWQWWLVVS